MPRSTLIVLFVTLAISIFFSRLNSRDVQSKYMMLAMKEKMSEMRKLQRRFRETQDERYYRKLLALQKEIMELQKKTFGYQMKRMLFSLVLFFGIYYALKAYYGYSIVAVAPFRIPKDIRSVPIEFSGKTISGLTFFSRYFLASISLSLLRMFLIDKVNKRNLRRGLARMFSRVF